MDEKNKNKIHQFKDEAITKKCVDEYKDSSLNQIDFMNDCTSLLNHMDDCFNPSEDLLCLLQPSDEKDIDVFLMTNKKGGRKNRKL